MNAVDSEINKQQLENRWVKYKKRLDENKDADSWFINEFIQKPMLEIINQLEPIIIEEFFCKKVTCIKHEVDEEGVDRYFLQKENDPRVYRLDFDKGEDWFRGLWHNAGYTELFWCGCGEVYDLFHKLKSEKIIK